mmetsp:Transcript_7803/g.12174  ORF Transcript_7803/g.12174 Transcript_7803/m.12174 type:complete len:222 (-) Transcript_7803:251-916(-)
MVALKSSVCRPDLGGRCCRILTMEGRKPMSSSWSHSSRMRHWRPAQASRKPGVFSRWSSSRPGVATRMSGVRRLKLDTSLVIFVPPNTTCNPRSWNFSSCLASSAICWASSRVGEMTSAETRPRRAAAGAAKMRSIAGRRKPRVLPVPVLAFASTSLPCRETGRVCACTRVIRSYPSTSASARCVPTASGASANLTSVSCPSVVLEVLELGLTICIGTACC